MKKIFSFFCLSVVLIQIFQILYFKRSSFLESYDVAYWKDRFEHSQWVLPLSKRIIGDDGLFAHIGHELIHGSNVAGFNAETPPVGKYLIGSFIVLFKNPSYYAMFFGILSLALFYLIAKRLFQNRNLSLLVTALLFIDPLFYSQFWRAWVDIPHLFFLFTNIFFLLLLNTQAKRAIIAPFLMGISLGFFIETKPPILLPLVLFLETLFFFFKKKQKEYMIFLAGILTAVLFSYSKFFWDGNTLIDLLKLKKYVLSFYLKSQLVVHHDAIWQTLFLGKFPNIGGGELISVDEWWIAWPIISVIGLCMSFLFLLKKDVNIIWKGLAVFVLGSLAIYTMIPAYPRYLVVVLPFLYLFFVKAVEKFFKLKLLVFFLMLVLTYGSIHAFYNLQSRVDLVLNNFYYSFSHHHFQDIYQESLSKKDKKLISRSQFRFLTQHAYNQGTIRKIHIQEKEREIAWSKSKGIIKLKVTYDTLHLGRFSEDKTVILVKEDGEWKIVWNWDLIFDGFLPHYSLETTRIVGKRGSIVDSNEKALVEDVQGYLISIRPDKIDTKRENRMIDLIGSLGYIKPVHLQNAYLENVLPTSLVPLVTVFSPVTEKVKRELVSFPGIELSLYPARIYKDDLDPLSIKNTVWEECCTRIYSSYSYHGVLGLDKKHDAILSGYDGGSILLRNKEGKAIRVILERRPKNGQDVAISL